MPKDGKIRDILDYLIELIGYLQMIKLKDCALLIAGVAVGMLITTLIMSKVIHRARHLEELGKVTGVRFKHGREIHYATRITSFKEALEFVVLMVYFPFTQKEQYTISDKKRAKWVLRIIIIITVLLCTLAYIFITHPLVKPEHLPPEWR